MKKIIYSCITATGILTASCEKDKVAEPAFTVTTDKTSYKAGEAVSFKFTGNPDFLVFFSGEQGKKYEFINRISALGKPVLSFETSAQNGTQVNSLSLMISSNFNGTYSAADVTAATWTDISSRAVLSTGTANVKSGSIDLTDFAGEKRVYLAFRFTGQQSATSAQRQWTIKNFSLNNVLEDGTVFPLFANISAPGWLAVDVKNSAVKWATPTATQLLINGGPVNTPDNEDWIISSGVNLRTVKPDVGAAVKDMSVGLNTHVHKYKEPGSYTATFVGLTNSVQGKKDVVKQLQLTITP